LKTDAYGRTARTLALTGPKRVRSHAAVPPQTTAAAAAPESLPTVENEPTAPATSSSLSSSSQLPPITTGSANGGGESSAETDPPISLEDTRLPAIDANGSSQAPTSADQDGGVRGDGNGNGVEGKPSVAVDGSEVLPSDKQKALEKLLRGGRNHGGDDDDEAGGGAENEEAEKEGAATGKFMAEMLLAASWLNVDEVSFDHEIVLLLCLA